MAVTVFMAIPEGKPGVKTFICDATMDVNVSYENEITTHKVDTRSTISSHAYNRNPEITLNAVVTGSYTAEDYANSPSLMPDQDNNLIGYDSDRVTQALSLLKDLWKNRTPFSIVTANDVYDNCILSSFSFSLDKKTSSDLVFKITAQQVRFARTERVVVTVLSPLVQDDAKDNQPGKKTKIDSGSEFNIDDAVGASVSQVVDSFNSLAGGTNE